MEESTKPREYLIAVDEASSADSSLAAVIAARRCYESRQTDIDEIAADADPGPYIGRIASHCADTSDYLLPDTPLKEAIFRELLAGGNKPRTAEDISEALSRRWAMATYPRDISPEVIGRLLEHGQGYGIAAVPIDEPEETEGDPAEAVEVVGEGAEEPVAAGDDS